jgi:hypothetical protein
VNARTGPSGCLLLRTPTEPPGSSVTSTQLPLEKLRELLTQNAFIGSLLVTPLDRFLAASWPVPRLLRQPGLPPVPGPCRIPRPRLILATLFEYIKKIMNLIET